MKTLLSGMQPTNQLTIGNYIGALRNWVELQAQYRCFFIAVDLHSITVRQDPKLLREQTYYLIAAYIAAGIDPSRCLLFAQSHVAEHAELAWILTCHASMGELSRMTQFKDKSARHGQHIPVGLFSYPVLMAADILLYDADLIPVGEDQKQHIELTRDLAERMNGLYGPGTCKLPTPFIGKVGARVMSLQNPEAKMSKSDENPHAAVFLTDSDDEIRKKFKRAVTDSGSVIRFSPADQPGVSNLLSIQSALTGETTDALVEKYQGKQYGHLKVETAEIVVAKIGPLRDRIRALMADKGELDRILRHGAREAREVAAATLRRVYERVGLIHK